MKRVGKESARSSRGGFTYKERSAESVKKRAERTGGRYDSPLISGVDSWRAKVGDNLIRILPPTWDDHDHYGYSVWVHSYIGPDNSTYVCPRKMKGSHCPVCDAARDARDSGEQEESKALEAKEQIWCWVIDRDSDQDPPVPQVYMMSWTMDRDIAALCLKRTGKVLLIDHPDRGQDVTIKRAGQGLKTKYYGQALEEPSPILEDEKDQDQILDYIQDNPIPSVIHYYSAEYLENVLSGKVDQKDVDADEKPAKRGRAVEEEDEEEEKPRRRSREVEDDDEKPRRRAARDDDEDDEPRRSRPPRDEEEKPRSRRSRDEEEEPPFDTEDRPTRRRPAVDDEVDQGEDDAPPRRSRRAADPEEEEPRRARSRAPREEEEEEEKPRSTRRAAPRDEEEEQPRRRRPAVEEEDEDEPVARRRIRTNR